MNDRQLSELVMKALGSAIAKDGDGAVTAVLTMGENSTDNQMYGVCCAFAEAGVHVLKKLYGERAADITQGDMWVLGELKPGAFADDPHKAFSLRFLTSYANNDRDNTLALYQAALDSGGESYVQSVCALLATVSGLARLALSETPELAEGDR